MAKSKSYRKAEAIWIADLKRWQIKVQRDGKRRAFVSSKPGRLGKHEVEAKADDWLKHGTDDVKFDAAWVTFLEYQKSHNGSANYRQIESLGRLYIKPNIRNRKLIVITPMMWQKCIDSVAAKGLSRRMCTNVSATISAFIVYARRERWTIDRLEKGDLVIPKSAPVGKRKILQPDDLKKLFTISTYTKWKCERPAFYIHAWRFFVITGMRRGELCGLLNEDIRNDVVHIQRSINEQGEETRGKNDNADRYFVLSAKAKKALEDQRLMLKRQGVISPWVFPDEWGERSSPKHVYELWRTYREQHGLSASLHELRHTFISIVKNDMPEPLLKALVGHSDTMDTFGVYGHEVSGDMKRTADIVDEVLGKLIGD